MNVLVDTSIWVDHFKRTNPHLTDLLVRDRVLTHPLIVGEIACGTPPSPRSKTLQDIHCLMRVHSASFDEVMEFIEENKLFGVGCGIVDVEILASTLITPNSKLWTIDRRLASLAQRFEVLYRHPIH